MDSDRSRDRRFIARQSNSAPSIIFLFVYHSGEKENLHADDEGKSEFFEKVPSLYVPTRVSLSTLLAAITGKNGGDNGCAWLIKKKTKKEMKKMKHEMSNRREKERLPISAKST